MLIIIKFNGNIVMSMLYQGKWQLNETYAWTGLGASKHKGLFIVANCLWSGRVIAKNDKNLATNSIRNLND